MPETVRGLMQGGINKNNPYALLESKYDGRTGITQSIAVDPRKVNAHKRKLMTLGPEKSTTIMSINTCLLHEPSGAESAFALALDLVGVDTLFTIAQLAASKPSAAVLARQGDEVWQLESLGKVGAHIEYVNYLLLVDPLRTRAQGKMPCEWVIHEERMEITSTH